MGKSKREYEKWPSDGAASGEAEPTTNREPSSLLEWPRCEGGRRSQLLRLSRVAREQGEAKHNALFIMNKKLIYRTSLKLISILYVLSHRWLCPRFLSLTSSKQVCPMLIWRFRKEKGKNLAERPLFDDDSLASAPHTLRACCIRGCNAGTARRKPRYRKP